MIVEGIHLKHVYGNGKGLHDISFQIKKGRIIALAGGNGAGKSTFIRLLTKQEKVMIGELRWYGEFTVRYMPDDVDFPAALTAEEVIQLLGALKKVTRQEQEFTLRKVGLYEVRKQKVSTFSKGMRQRLNLAQSLLGEEGLLIMDEPTNGLDPFWTAQLKKFMVAERNRGNTILFSTHLLSLAQELADDIIVLHNGQVLLSGVMEELLEQHSCNLEQLWLSMIGL